MAFNSARNNAPAQDTSWKADRFINCRLPAKDGTEPKIGTFFLKLSDKRQAKLIEWLDSDPEKNLPIMLSKMKFDYRSAEPKDTAGFDLED